MGFLDGGVAAAFSGMFSGFYLDAKLFRSGTFTDDGAGGGDDDEFAESENVKVQPERTSEDMRGRPGYTDTDKRYLMLAHDVDEPDTDCEIEAEGQRWLLFHCSKDPATAYYDCHCRKLRNLDES